MQKIEINTNAVSDEEIVVTRLTAARVTDASAVADRNETVDTVLRSLVCTDAVVAALDRLNVFKNDVATISMNIEAVVILMRGREVADDKMSIFTTKLHTRRADGESNVGLFERLPWFYFEEE